MQKTFLIENLGDRGIDIAADVLQDQIAEMLTEQGEDWTRIKSVLVNFDKDTITVEFAVKESNVIQMQFPVARQEAMRTYNGRFHH